jgi:hypothetical protein
MKSARYVISFALTVALSMITVADSEAFWKTGKEKKKTRSSIEETFAVSGVFTGSLEGQIVIGKKKVSLTDKTVIYFVGEGARDDNPFVSGASVYIGGVIKDGSRQAAFVVVRRSRLTQVSHHRQARDANHSIPSPANPNVGRWVEGYE